MNKYHIIFTSVPLVIDSCFSFINYISKTSNAIKRNESHDQ